MSYLGWIVAIGIIAIALYALILVTYPVISNRWQTEHDYATARMKRQLELGEISPEAYSAMRKMHMQGGSCDYCHEFHFSS